MSPEGLNAIEQELIFARQELNAARAQMQTVLDRDRRRRVSTKILNGGAVLLAVVLFGLLRTPRVVAQPQNRFSTPFFIVDNNGDPVVTISGGESAAMPRGITMYSPGAHEVASVLASSWGGRVVMRNEENTTRAVLEVDEKTSALSLESPGREPVHLDPTIAQLPAPLRVMDLQSKRHILDVTPAMALTVNGAVTTLDAAGRKAVQLDPGGFRGLSVFNGLGNYALVAAAPNGAGDIHVYDGQTRMGRGSGVYVNESQNGVLEVTGGDGATRAIIDTDNGSALQVIDSDDTRSEIRGDGVRIYNSSAAVVGQLNADTDGYGGLVVRDKTGKASAGLLMTAKGSLLALADPGGKVKTELSSYSGLALFNGGGKTTVWLKTLKETGDFKLMNQNGNAQVQATVLDGGRGMVAVFARGGPQPFPVPQALEGHR